MIKMPPQAYTKEVLAAAFDWLSNQPEYVRQKIASSDDLVGLYLKSTRLKQDFNKDLSSAKNFRNELQDLAQNLKQFEEKEEAPKAPSRAMSIPMAKDESAYRVMENDRGYESLGAEYGTETGAPNASATRPSTGGATPNPAPKFTFNPQSVVEPAVTTPSVAKASGKPSDTNAKVSKLSEGEIVFKLDQKTLSALNLAKDRLNLSSDTEALRVLVSLGEKHLKKLFSSED